MAELVDNDIHTVTVPDVGEVGLRLQTYSDGALGVRSVPDKDGVGEFSALAAIGMLHRVLEAEGAEHRLLTSRRMGVLVADALHIRGAAARGAEFMERVSAMDPSEFPVTIP